jgi:hypothetical protein
MAIKIILIILIWLLLGFLTGSGFRILAKVGGGEDEKMS